MGRTQIRIQKRPALAMYNNVHPYQCEPPGTFCETIAHPGGYNRSIEKAIMMEHRFAFFFWMKWSNTLQQEQGVNQPPALFTIDWHRDLAPPTQKQKEGLQALDQANLSDVSNYVWAQFDQTNDSHILCAAWLDLIGDIILLQNTTGYQQDTFMDMNGKEHTIYEFREFDRFADFMIQRNDDHLFWDIDLDYFIHGKGKKMYSDDFHRYSDEEIKAVIDYNNLAFNQILPAIEGITIAQEPGYCGGIANSCSIMNVLHSQLFDESGNWHHLQE